MRFSCDSTMIVEQVREVLKIEAEAIMDLVARVGPEFAKAVQIILEAKGRVILTGMGKSGLVGRKIAATLSSTGTPAFFLHPAEATHGDLGMVTGDDIVLAISNSGQTSEINHILPVLKKIGVKILSFTGVPDSTLALESDAVIDVAVKREACPMGLAPTASTTAALAMGDALAVVLMNSRRFSSKDFKVFHPGGSLGERLSTKVREVMFTDDRVPAVVIGSDVGKAIKEIDAKGIGATLVVDKDKRLEGIITDGDIRRALTRRRDVHDMKVEEIMSLSPKIIHEDQTAAEALGIMELYGITHLCIVNLENQVKGIVHLHDLFGREEFHFNGGNRFSSGSYR